MSKIKTLSRLSILMDNKAIRYLVVILLLLSSRTYKLEATHEFSFGIEAAATANNLLLANPPLPMLYYDKGKYKITVQPYIFNGKMDFTDASPSGNFKQRGKFSGWGAGGSFSYGLARKWGLYSFIVGSAISNASFFYGGSEAGNTQSNDSDILGANASFVTFNVDGVYQFFGKKEGGFSLPVFFGPTLTRVKFNQTIVERYGDIPNQPLRKQIHTDFDMEGTQFVPGVLLGTQAGIPLGKYFKLIPFLMFGMHLQDGLSYNLGTVRTDLESATNSQSTLFRIKSGEKVQISQKFGSIGLNLVFNPWGLSFNLTGPILKKSILGQENLEMTQFSFSYSFGKYEK